MLNSSDEFTFDVVQIINIGRKKQTMSSKKGAMKKKLGNMHLSERINYGYKMVITMMLISGLLSIAVIGVLFSNMLNYVNKVNASDQAVKVCRINVTAAARDIREMALILTSLRMKIMSRVQKLCSRMLMCS